MKAAPTLSNLKPVYLVLIHCVYFSYAILLLKTTKFKHNKSRYFLTVLLWFAAITRTIATYELMIFEAFLQPQRMRAPKQLDCTMQTLNCFQQNSKIGNGGCFIVKNMRKNFVAMVLNFSCRTFLETIPSSCTQYVVANIPCL